MKNLKKFAAILVIGCIAAAQAVADPIGITAGLDGFAFGNVAGEDYEFAGDFGKGSVNPFVQFNKGITDALSIEAKAEAPISFATDAKPTIGLYVQGGYGLAVGGAGKLDLFLRPAFAIPTDSDQKVAIGLNAMAKYTQTLGFGSLWGNFGFGATFQDKLTTIGTAIDNFRVGVNTNAGVYGYVDVPITFSVSYDGTDMTPDDLISSITVRAGYNKLLDGNLDIRADFVIPTVEDGIKNSGLTIEPRFTYSNIVPGLAVYLDLAIGNIGAEEPDDMTKVGMLMSGLVPNDGKVSFSPTIGVSYAF